MPDNYPFAAFHFNVEWGGKRIGFSEVTGLTQENQLIEYREGSSKEFSTIKMPGLRKFANLVCKRGVTRADNEFFSWFATATRLKEVERRNIVVSLLDENHNPVMVWNVHNAFPVKVEGPQLKATGNEVAIESIEIAHEGLELQNNG